MARSFRAARIGFGVMALSWVVVGTAGVGRAEFAWKQLRHSNIPYVGLDSLMEFYEWKQQGVRVKTSIISGKQEYMRLVGPLGEWLLRKGSREMYLNKRLVWMSFPLHEDPKTSDLYFSRVDLVKLLEPLFRPGEIIGRKGFDGVVIDAGHGGADSGAKSRGLREKELNLDLAFRLRRELKARKIPAVMTRYRDTFLTLEERAKIASKYKNFVFVSLHFNYSRSRKSEGVEVYSLTPRFSPSSNDRSTLKRSDREEHPGNTHDELNAILAQCIHESLMKLNPKPVDRGMKRARFVVLRRAGIPAVLIEGGFVTNLAESKKLKNQVYRDEMAKLIVEGLERYNLLVGSTP